jgi:hypothetical protein
MKHIFPNLILLIFLYKGFSQATKEVHFVGGFSNYTGDLQPKRFTLVGAGQSLGATFSYGFSSHFHLRGTLAINRISADDANNPPALRVRNLNFISQVTEGFLAVEYRLFSLPEKRWTPYAFAGAGVFGFNPYVLLGEKEEKVYLQPLGTEGQGLPEYPDRSMYKLTQFFVPFGGGLKFLLTDSWILGVEVRLNKTFTDYLDDVSTKYPLPAPLLRDRGPVAVQLSWRRDEYDGRPFPNNEPIRGEPSKKDWYYQVGATIGYVLPNGRAGTKFKGVYNRKKGNQLGCPKW